MVTNAGPVKTGAWDPEEDELLYYWQSKVGNKWSEVAKHIPGRTGQQCAQRWRHKVNPNIRRDKWTAEEDAKLMELVKTFGVGRWAEIARNCDGRTDQQCMGRWRRHLDPSIRRDSWTPEEDAKLRQLHAQYGTSWSRISKCLKGRTSQQCRARWHQINHGRSKAAAGAQAPAADALADAADGGAAASGARQAASARRGSQPGKRRPSGRRRLDDTDSEEEEEDEDEDEELDEEEDDDDEDEWRGHTAGRRRHAAARCAEVPALGQPDALQPPTAAGLGLQLHGAALPCSVELGAQGWPAGVPVGPGAAAAAAASGHRREVNGDLALGADQEGGQGEPSAEADYGCGLLPQHSAVRPAGGSRAGRPPALGRYSSLPSGKQQQQQQRTDSLRHTSSLPAAKREPAAGEPRGLWSAPSGQQLPQQQQQQQQQQQGHWSPSRLLLSPPPPPTRGVQQAQQPLRRRVKSRSSGGGGGPDDEEETEGAETLLQMASSLLRRESCEFEPPSLRRSDFITASTPPKRAAGERPDLSASDDLSPSPFKRARSASRTALFGAQTAPPQASGLGPGGRSRAAAAAAAGGCSADDMDSDDADSFGTAAARQQQLLQQLEEAHRHHGGGCRGGGAAAREQGAEGGGRRRAGKRASAGAARGDGSSAEEEEEEEVEDEGGEAAGGGFGGCVLDFALGGGGDDYAAAAALPDPARPSNASSLTVLHGGADGAAAALLSPPPAPRLPGGRRWHPPSGAAAVTPRRPMQQQHNPMGMLGSPSFERMPGCASPAASPADRTQPSNATLAALQSPQPSRVHEPFWTPFTGLFKDALFTRGTSATPDLLSGGKVRAGGLFSPGKRSGGSSGSSGRKTVPRRALLSGAASPSPLAAQALAGAADGAAAAPGHGGALPAAAGADGEPGPSPAAACGLQPAAQQVHHRVVRRLDQHEAWGASSAASPSPAKHAAGGGVAWAAAGSAVKPPRGGDAPLGDSFSLFSPVRKQRVPLFSEGGAGGAITVGASPAKPGVGEEDDGPLAGVRLTIAPLSHDLPSSSDPGLHGVQPGAAFAASAVQQPADAIASPGGAASAPGATAAACALPASALRPHCPSPLSRQQAAAESYAEGEEEGAAAGPEAAVPQLSGAANPPGTAQPQQEGEHHQHASDASHSDGPDTPVHLRQRGCDGTSCSGTPSTPGCRAPGSAQGGGAAGSPSDFVTPKHMPRPSRPLAPLHKDCLANASTRGPGGADAPGVGAGRGGKGGKGGLLKVAATAAAVAAAAAAAAAGSATTPVDRARAAAAQQLAGSAPGSADSSRLLSPARSVDSPLQPSQQAQSPSQWHQGMVAMLRNLQQTPLQPKAPGSAEGDAAGRVAGGAEEARSRAAGSRALRRLQHELERGGGAAQQHYARGGPADDAAMPFAAAALPPAPPAALGGASAPMLLPLFSAPAGGGVGAQVASGEPLALGMAASSLASVSLVPAIVSRPRAERPATSSAAAAAAAPAPPASMGLPAVAWPVQQRPDGALEVKASPGGSAPAGAVVQLTPPLGGATGRLGAPGSREHAGAAALLQCAAPPPGAPEAASVDASLLLQQLAVAAAAIGGEQGGGAFGQWPQGPAGRVVVSIQPVTMIGGTPFVGAGAPLPGALAATQPGGGGGACSSAAAAAAAAMPSAAPRSMGSAAAATAAAGGAPASDRFDVGGSHAVRNRLHALIDGI